MKKWGLGCKTLSLTTSLSLVLIIIIQPIIMVSPSTSNRNSSVGEELDELDLGRIHPPEDIHFYLFPFRSSHNYTEEIHLGNWGSLHWSSFIPQAPLNLIFVHGYQGQVFDPDTTLHLINGYLSSGVVGNFIAVEWGSWGSKGSGGNGGKNRPINLSRVAARITGFISWLLHENMASLSQFHLIGHSLGTQIVGDVGSRLIQQQKKQNSGQPIQKINRITGLDPTLPPGLNPKPSVVIPHWLSKRDADFIDVYHTNELHPLDIGRYGHVDIYVNNGNVQPGCHDLSPTDASACGHNWVIWMYVASFQEVWVGCHCPRDKFHFANCHRPCWRPIRIGPYISVRARGTFTLDTISGVESSFESSLPR